MRNFENRTPSKTMSGIVIIDYGLGNIKSISNAFSSVGSDVTVSRDTDTIMNATGLVLPGVGAFQHGMEKLRDFGLVDIIKERAGAGVPLLGICLGMQLMLSKGEEFGQSDGLDLISGEVVKFNPAGDVPYKLPNIGWNELSFDGCAETPLLQGVAQTESMYFVHSFYANPTDVADVLSCSDFAGIRYCSTIGKDNVFGCQYHPEKSGESGLKIIRNFKKICEGG